SHDRDPAAPADPRPSPARPPCGRVDPAPATRPSPAQRGPRPHPRPTRDVLTVGPPRPRTTRNHAPPEATIGPSRCPAHENPTPYKITGQENDHPVPKRGFGSDKCHAISANGSGSATGP